MEQSGKTVGLVLQMCKPLFSTGKAVVMDSGFAVLDALIQLRRNGVFGLIMVKKRKYWPKFIDGEAIKQHMANKPVGSVDSLPGQKDNQRFHIFAMKDPDYVTILMSTFGALRPVEGEGARATRRVRDPDGQIQTVEFQYHEPFYYYFRCRGSVDCHNAKRHKPISLEETWHTVKWILRVFAFVIAVCEINTYIVAVKKFNIMEEVIVLDLRKLLAEALINNTYDGRASARVGKRQDADDTGHGIRTAPKFLTLFRNGCWIQNSKLKYPQCMCRHPGCRRKIRTYCLCDPGFFLCSEHVGYHIHSLDISS